VLARTCGSLFGELAMTKKFILKFEQSSEQRQGPVCRIVGFVAGKTMLPLLDNAELSANPRAAKSGAVTAEIIKSLKDSSDIFPFKTKGILIASTRYRPLERDRYEINFNDSDIEGILDGGHNALAIGSHILEECGIDIKGIKTWEQFTNSWRENREIVEVAKDELTFLVPIELLVPSEINNSEVIEEFTSSLVDICEARNNNVSLTEETQANKRGLYDVLRAFLPEEISNNVEWRSNQGGRIKPREIIALSWIPLSLLKLPNDYYVNPNQIYRNKGVCVEMFSRMMKDPKISSQVDGTGTYELKHDGVESALKLLSRFPELFDQLYSDLPHAYNQSGGSFGRISAVKMFDQSKISEKNSKYLKHQPLTPFFQTPVSYTCPDGFLVPLLYSLRALIKDDQGILKWKVDPAVFLRNKLSEILKSYKLAIEMSQWDPQKTGKSIYSYQFAETIVAALMSNR
jgi:hypothetical protein